MNHPHASAENGNATCEASEPQRREFSVHPAIILSLVREQSSSLGKALAELIMNSVDAGATKIDLQMENWSFRLTDDGRGFGSAEEIERVFGVFGLPHKKGDAEYGRFRVGRGQIMAHASVTWCSGHHRMHVDLRASEARLGYTLSTVETEQPGCVVQGTLFAGSKSAEGHTNTHHGEDDHLGSNYYLNQSAQELANLVRYIEVPVTLNGKLITIDAKTQEWDHEDEFAWYKFDYNHAGVTLFDRGLLVSNTVRLELGRGALIVTKQALSLNMARNEVSWGCPVWNGIKQGVREAFDIRLQEGKKLEREDAIDLIQGLLKGRFKPLPQSRKSILSNRFLKDVFGTPKTLGEMLGEGTAHNDVLVFSEYSSEFSMVAERVQKEGRAIVLPSWFVLACYRVYEPQWSGQWNEHTCAHAVEQLRKALGMPYCHIRWASLTYFHEQIGYTYELIDEKTLSPEEALILKSLRAANQRFPAKLKRKIMVGDSPELNGWTDGLSYIAISRKSLMQMRAPGGHIGLIALLMHEYAHGEPSVQEHAHDLGFYSRYHDFMRDELVLEITEYLFRHYARAMAKAKLQPSKSLRYHVSQMGVLESKLRVKRGSWTFEMDPMSPREKASMQNARNPINPDSKLLSAAVVGGAGPGLPPDVGNPPPGMGAVLLYVPSQFITGMSLVAMQADMGLPWSDTKGQPYWFPKNQHLLKQAQHESD